MFTPSPPPVPSSYVGVSDPMSHRMHILRHSARANVALFIYLHTASQVVLRLELLTASVTVYGHNGLYYQWHPFLIYCESRFRHSHLPTSDGVVTFHLINLESVSSLAPPLLQGSHVIVNFLPLPSVHRTQVSRLWCNDPSPLSSFSRCRMIFHCISSAISTTFRITLILPPLSFCRLPCASLVQLSPAPVL